MQGKEKALKSKHKQIVDKLRKSGAGRDLDEESQESLEFPYLALLKVVVRRRVSDTCEPTGF